MKKILTASAIAAGMIFSSAAAFSSTNDVHDAISEIMAEYNIPGTAENASIYQVAGGETGEDSPSAHYIAWIDLSPQPGALVVETDIDGNVIQMYTRFGGSVEGVNAY